MHSSFFNNERFAAASRAYKRAGKYQDANVADAYGLRELARQTQSLDRPRRFEEAARAFMECGSSTDHLKIAGECWAHSGDNRKAAETFIQAKRYTIAAQYYRQGKMFDDLVKLLDTRGTDIENTTAKKLKDAAKYHYFQVTRSY